MVNLIWTPRLERAFQKLDAISSSKAPLTSSMKTPWPNAEETQTVQEVCLLLQSKDRVSVEFDLIRRVSAMLLKYDRSTASPTDSNVSHLDASEDWAHVMIKGSAVYIPKPAPKERSPELDRIMDDVKAKLAEREYRRMISSIDYTASSNGSISSGIRQDMKELKEVKAHTIGIINVLYTGAAVFTAVYMISGHFTEDLGKRVLMAFLAFVLIVACEAYLYMRHASAATGPPRKRRTPKLPDDVVIGTRAFIKENSS